MGSGFYDQAFSLRRTVSRSDFQESELLKRVLSGPLHVDGFIPFERRDIPASPLPRLQQPKKKVPVLSPPVQTTQVVETGSWKHCSSCGCKLNQDIKFCNECGTKVGNIVWFESLPLPATECPRCGCGLEIEDDECRHCHELIDRRTRDVLVCFCKAVPSSGANYCPNCGKARGAPPVVVVEVKRS